MFRPETDRNQQRMIEISLHLLLFINMFYCGFSYKSVLWTVIILYAIIFYQYDTEITRIYGKIFHGASFAPFTDQVKAHVSDNELSDNDSDLDYNDEVQQATAPDIAAGRIQTRWRKFRSSQPPGWSTTHRSRDKACFAAARLNRAAIQRHQRSGRRRPGTLTEVPSMSFAELREESRRMKNLALSPSSSLE